MGDHWKVVFEFYMKMVIAAWHLWGVQLCIIQVPYDQNALNVQSIHSNILRRIRRDTRPSSPPSILSSLLWSGPNTIINPRDPMQNSDQTWIFYKAGQTCLTQTKHDLDDLTRFQPWYIQCVRNYICMCIQMLLRMYVCMYVWMDVWCIHMYICVYLFVYMCMYGWTKDVPYNYILWQSTAWQSTSKSCILYTTVHWGL